MTQTERAWLAANAPGGWIDNMREALKQIAERDWVENALNPQWSRDVARKVLGYENKTAADQSETEGKSNAR